MRKLSFLRSISKRVVTNVLSVIGISYSRHYMTTEAVEAIQNADIVIGHEEFLAQIRDLVAAGARAFDVLDDIAPGESFLAARVRHAVSWCDTGHRVCIVSSGDSGVFGMSGAVFRELAHTGRHDLLNSVQVVPGISAYQILASRLGGPLTNGFATFALCMDTVPIEMRRKRIKALAAADMVVVVFMLRHGAETWPELYPDIQNPRAHSEALIREMLEVFAEVRPRDAACFIATDMEGAEESVTKATLSDLILDSAGIQRNSILLISNAEISEMCPNWFSLPALND